MEEEREVTLIDRTDVYLEIPVKYISRDRQYIKDKGSVIVDKKIKDTECMKQMVLKIHLPEELTFIGDSQMIDISKCKLQLHYSPKIEEE